MPKKTSAAKQEDIGRYLWRGGQRIELEKEGDRFTVMPSGAQQLEKLKTIPGVRAVKPVNSEVFKVETSSTQLNSAMEAARSEAVETIAHHAYRPKDSEGTIYYITDRIMVAFKPGTGNAKIDKLLDKYKLRLLKEYENLPDTYLLQVTSDSGENPVKIANRLAEEPAVASAEVNMVNRFQRAFIPPDGLFPRQWHLKSKTRPQLAKDASVQAPDAWDITRGDRGITVAFLDDGFDLSHPDFQGPGKVVFPSDYVDGDSQPFPVTAEGDYHGTAVAGVAIAESNGRGVVGIAHGCAFMPVRFPLALDDDEMVEIFEEVAEKADIISCSWGPPPVYAPLSFISNQTIRRLATTGGPRGKGCVICFAAGNDNAPLNERVNEFVWRHPDYGRQVSRGRILNGWAAHPNVIAVAASTSLNKHSAYSNWGKEISVCAPSNNFHPHGNRAMKGRGIWSTDNHVFGGGFTPRSRYTGRFGGTSSATPLVAGVAALVLSANPSLTAAEVKEILQSTADKIVDTDPDIVLGTNRGQYNAQGRCDWFGFGKVNAARAVAEAKRRLHA